MTEVTPPKELIGLPTQVTGSSQPKFDVINGWNFKTSDINSAEIDGLVPFVQLYGLYSGQEIQKLLNNDPDWSANAITAVFVGEDGFEEENLNDLADQYGSYAGTQDERRRTIADDQIEYINSKLRSKFIHINIQDETHRNIEQYTPGILLASNKAQAGNEAYEYYNNSGSSKDSGGVGIIELQIQTGTKEFMNRRYKLRLIVTDPQELNEEAQYLKLTSLQSEFLIIHGWASPNSLNGWPGDSPPTLEPATEQFPNGRLFVDLTQSNTAGGWGAAVVATTMFDFAFNEVGQLEASFTFMPREISFLSTYRVPTVADIVKRFLGTGEKITPTDPNNPDSTPNIFAGLSTGLGLSMGLEGKNLADVIFDEQSGYITKSNTIMGLFDRIEDGTGINVSSEISNWAESDSEWTGNTASLIEKQKEREGRFRFPYAGPGIRVYTRERRQVLDPERNFELDPTSEDEDAPENPISLRAGYKWITESKSKIAYYYLGWVFEAIRFSMYDLNQQKARRGETPFNVRFKYMAVPENSQSTFNLSFQDELKSGLVPSVKNYIQEATKFLMTNCFPSFHLYNPMWMELQIYDDQYDMRPMVEQDMKEIPTAEAYKILGGYNDIKMDGNTWLHDNISENINWETASFDDKIRYLSVKAGFRQPGESVDPFDTPAGPANWRQTLVIDENNYVRILHPRYEGQILYTYVAHTSWATVSFTSMERNNPVYTDRSNAENINKGGVLGSIGSPGAEGTARNPQDRTDSAEGQYIEKSAGSLQAMIRENPSGRYTGYIPRRFELPVIDNWREDEEWQRNNPQLIEVIPGQLRPPEIRRSSDSRFIGDITYTSEYGLLMPAEVARYYSNEYLAAQRRWYNIHIAFLAKKVQEIVGKRITEAVQQGKDISKIGPEPVDLYWLTGKKYFTPAVQEGIGEKANLQPAYPIVYRFEDIRGKAAELRFTLNSAIIKGLEDKIDAAKVEKERIENINSGNIDVYGIARSPQSLARGAQEITAAQQQLNSIDSLTAPPFSTIPYENKVASLIRKNRGLVGEEEFWNERINIILADLYNKDLINLEGAGSGEGNPTLSARLAPPEGAEELILPDPTTEAANLDEFFQMAELYTPIVAQRLRNTITSPSSRNFSNLLPYNDVDGEMGYYLLFNGVPGTGTGNRSDENTYVGAAYLQNAGLANENYYEYNRQIGRFIMTKYDIADTPLTLDTVDQLGDIGITQENLDIDSISDINFNVEKVEYIFINWVSSTWRNRYFAGLIMYNQAAEDVGSFNAIKAARRNYFDYITKQRAAIKRYLENINNDSKKITKLILSTANVDRIQAEAQDQLNGINMISKAISQRNSQELSPFEGPIPNDASISLGKGGGRYVKLDTIVAQQWEQRFQKREVFGSNDIHNYGPPVGGLPYHDPLLPTWGWLQAEDVKNNLNISYMLAEKIGVMEIKGKPNFGDWDGPKEILNLQKLGSTLVYEFGSAREGRYFGDKEEYNVIGEVLNNENEWINGQPNILLERDPGNIRFANLNEQSIPFFETASDEERSLLEASGSLEEITYITLIQVKHLIRAGMVDFNLIAELMKYKYGFEDVGYELGQNVKTIIGIWPTSFHYSYADFQYGNADPNLIVEPYYRVDKDLDFVEEAYRQSTEGMKPFEGRGKTGERYLNGLDPMELIKVSNSSCVFGPLSSVNARNLMYPTARGQRLAMNDHLPTITREGAQQMVDNRSRALTADGNPGPAKSDDDEGYSPNPEWIDVPERLGATWDYYNNEGRPAYSDEYLYGVPSGTPVPDPKEDGTYPDGYQPVATLYDASTDDALAELSINSYANAPHPFQGTTTTGSGSPSSDIFFGLGVPDLLKRGSWLAGRARAAGADGMNYVGGASAPRIHDILYSLPDEFQYGFFSSVKDADENFGGGAPLNFGLVNFINEHLIQLLHMGRRIGLNADKLNEPEGETLKNYYTGDKRDKGGNYVEANRIRDVTYADCFNDLIQRTQNMADFSNQKIENVAEIPIRREVVDNLLNRRNHNMSLLQLCQQILSPSSIGLAGNVQIGVRNTNGLIEIFPASISYKGIVQDMFKNAIEEKHLAGDFTDINNNQLTFDYKRKNSLIQSIDMSSKMDPAAFLTYQNSSDILRGRDYNILKLLSIDGIASEMAEFLSAIPKADDDSGGTYSGIVNVGVDRKVRINKVAFENIPSGILDSFVAQDPQRWAQITAMMQEQNNFTTELLAFYMRSVTLIIHGTTNIEPFNLIYVKGVLPALEGVYIITNLTQRITPTDFQTIIEGKLLKRRRLTRTGSEFI